MANQNTSMRFDTREIAVIFTLFIFVSLLMFTVGILVGKGLATARYEAALMNLKTKAGENAHEAEAFHPSPSTSVSTHPVNQAKKAHHGKSAHDEPDEEEAPVAHKKKEPKAEAPAKHKSTEAASTAALEALDPKNSDHLMKDPKIKNLIEDDGAPAKARGTASIGKEFPTSFNDGKFTVQVGSYPTKHDAEERVAFLKKLGFPYAYFSVKELGDSKETWYRVWTGYYPDADSARASGEALQNRGEVKNYLVRKTDTPG